MWRFKVTVQLGFSGSKSVSSDSLSSVTAKSVTTSLF